MAKPKTLRQYNVHWLDAVSHNEHFTEDEALPTASEFRGTLWLIAKHDDEYVFASLLANTGTYLGVITIPAPWVVKMKRVVKKLNAEARPAGRNFRYG